MKQKEKEEELWSWGAGTEGQLGTTKLEDSHLPQLLPSLALPISQLACGGAHVIALTQGGGGRPCSEVLSWGRGTSGQLGHGDLENCLYPKGISFFERFVVSHVSAGWSHSGFVSGSGRVFTCGDGSFGQLGHGDFQSHCSPVEVLTMGSSDKHVEQIACGMRHSLVLLKGGHSTDKIYGFGSGKRGQLGFTMDKFTRSYNLPQVVAGVEDIDIVTITTNGDHSAALTIDGHLFTWGRGFLGNSDAYLPQFLSSPLKFMQIALGWNHILLLTDDGDVFMLGGNHHGMLSDPHKTSMEQKPPTHSNPCQSSDGPSNGKTSILREVAGLNGIKVVNVAAGAEHSALVTESGEIMTWGWGEHGQLGLGDSCDQTIPQSVSLGDGFRDNHNQTRVYCGSGFTYGVRSNFSIS